RGVDEPQERARRALQLACGASGGGHLYLVGPSGLTLVASQGSRAATGDMAALASEFLTQTTTATDDATKVETTTAESAASADAGVLAVLLGCMSQGSYVHAGVLLLTSEPSVPIHNLRPLLEALAEHLIAAGDVSPQIPETQAQA
ncbi:MAG TPA: hypothetical protein VJV78_04195, partial [Polyangiales bacterium]|nr:hypothetical protein [Polyangiales bacterium]